MWGLLAGSWDKPVLFSRGGKCFLVASLYSVDLSEPWLPDALHGTSFGAFLICPLAL